MYFSKSSVRATHAFLHHPPQCGVDIAVVQQFVGELIKQQIGVEIESALRAVPSGVGEARRHVSKITRYEPTGPSCRVVPCCDAGATHVLFP